MGKKNIHKNTKNIVGKRFGKLTAIENTFIKKNDSYIWKCLCDCGNFHMVTVRNLPKTKSCGCLGPGKKLPKGEASFNFIFYKYLKSAKLRGHEFKLSKAEFKAISQQNCSYCGSEPKDFFMKAGNGPFRGNGLDRVDNSKGYEVSNCVPCCFPCNYMKRDKSVEEFLTHLEKIIKHSKPS